MSGPRRTESCPASSARSIMSAMIEFCSLAVASGPSRESDMWASSVAMRWAISRTTVRIVPSAGSRTDP